MGARKILIVDDDTVNSEVLAQRLTKRGYEVVTHEVGAGTLELLELSKFELVLLDIMLPDVSGIEVLKNLRAKYKQVEVPVIMVTAKDSPQDVAEALRMGASDYISKPIHLDVAIARINTQLSIVDLYRENMQRQQIESVNAVIITYNHEINNPLAIALGNLSLGLARNDRAAFEKAEAAMRRVADIVKKINEVTKSEIELTSYTSDSKMIKIK